MASRVTIWQPCSMTLNGEKAFHQGICLGRVFCSATAVAVFKWCQSQAVVTIEPISKSPPHLKGLL